MCFLAARREQEERRHIGVTVSEGEAAGARGLPGHGADVAAAAERHAVPGRGNGGDPGAHGGRRACRTPRRLLSPRRRAARRRRLVAGQWSRGLVPWRWPRPACPAWIAHAFSDDPKLVSLLQDHFVCSFFFSECCCVLSVLFTIALCTVRVIVLGSVGIKINLLLRDAVDCTTVIISCIVQLKLLQFALFLT